MSSASDADDVFDVVITAVPIDHDAILSFKATFVDHEVIHSHSFTGLDTLTAIGHFTSDTLGKVLSWFTARASRYQDATIEIGTEKVLLKGYALDEANDFLKSSVVNRLLKDLKKR